MRRELYTLRQGDGTQKQVWLLFINGRDELRPYLAMLVRCYKEIFAGAPYFENYDGKEDGIERDFNSFADDGILALAVAMPWAECEIGEVIGFSAGIGIDKSEVREFLEENKDLLEVPMSSYIYMAELGVIESMRRMGLGKALIEARIREAKSNLKFVFTHFIMRTAKEGSNSARIYLRLGARLVQGLIQKKEDFGTQSTERIFLSRKL